MKKKLDVRSSRKSDQERNIMTNARRHDMRFTPQEVLWLKYVRNMTYREIICELYMPLYHEAANLIDKKFDGSIGSYMGVAMFVNKLHKHSTIPFDFTGLKKKLLARCEDDLTYGLINELPFVFNGSENFHPVIQILDKHLRRA